MTREENIRVFEDTYAECSNNYKLRTAVRGSVRKQRLILEGEEYTPKETEVYDKTAKIIVSGKRTMEAAENYRGMNTAVLNFASAATPGGGVRKGSSAQEESLCRISTLYPCLRDKRLWDNYYSLNRMRCDRRNTDSVIYTPSVIVFRSDDNDMEKLGEREWYSVNVLSAAAPDLRSPRPGDSDYGVRETRVGGSEIYALHYRRMKRILEIAAGEGNEVIVLGAFGCGAFRNPPSLVARALKSAVLEYINRFRTIEFAVYTHPDRDSANYRAFRSEFLSLM